jgi:hypothetical protein
VRYFTAPRLHGFSRPARAHIFAPGISCRRRK